VATKKQELGAWGEDLIVKKCACPKCKRSKTLKRLPANFKCADLVCDFCGYLAQVKSMNVKSLTPLPKQVLGAAWGPQKARMDAAIYFPLFLVLKSPSDHAVYYLPTDFQSEALFTPRSPLSETAKRAGWQGFMYNLEAIPQGAMVKLL
jgi:type II restriction enzyme